MNTDSPIKHCGQKTRVLDTRDGIRKRECRVCGYRFKTEEVIVSERVTKGRYTVKRNVCPITRDEMEQLMDKYPSLRTLAKELHTSTATLNRWLQEYDL